MKIQLILLMSILTSSLLSGQTEVSNPLQKLNFKNFLNQKPLPSQPFENKFGKPPAHKIDLLQKNVPYSSRFQDLMPNHHKTLEKYIKENRSDKSQSKNQLFKNSNSDGVDTAWVRYYESKTISSSDGAKAISCDSDGNVYVTGESFGSNSYFDFATIKYDANGNQLWVSRYNGSGDFADRGIDIALDSKGNILVTGYSYESGTNYDFTTIKYDSHGNQLWVATYNGSTNGDDCGLSIAVDIAGNVYVTGYSSFENSIKFVTIKYDEKGNNLWVATSGLNNTVNIPSQLVIDDQANVYVTGYSGYGEFSADYTTIKYDKEGNQIWIAKYDGTANYIDVANAIAIDSSGNVFVTGYSYNSGSGEDCVTIKYDSDGNRVWVSKFNGPANYSDGGTDIKLDASGNIYVTGGSDNERGYSDYLTIKYTLNGNELWSKRYNGSANFDDVALALEIDLIGNVYVTGFSYDSSTFTDYTTIKYDSNGNQKWINKYSGKGSYGDYAIDIALDAQGSVYVTGQIDDGETFFDYATLKYDTNGNQLFLSKYDGPGYSNDMTVGLSRDKNGNIYVAVQSKSTKTNHDYLILKYDVNGNLLWIERYDNERGEEYLNGFFVDEAGNIYVTGVSYSSQSSSVFLTIKYDDSGKQLWTAKYNSPYNSIDYATALAVDLNGNVYVIGRSHITTTYSDFATIKYDSFGNLLWVSRYSGSDRGFEEPTSIAYDSEGNVYVTGYSPGIETIYDFVTIKYDKNGNQVWTDRYSSQGSYGSLATNIKVDVLDNVYVTGYNSTSTCANYVTLKYDPNGNKLWTNTYDGPGNCNDLPTCLSLDTKGNIYVGGYSYGIGTMEDFAILKYDTDGNKIWLARYNGFNNNADYASDLVIDKGGNVYVTGSSYGIGTWTDFTTVKFDSNGVQKWVATYNGVGNYYDGANSIVIDSIGNLFISGSSSFNTGSRAVVTIRYSQVSTSVGTEPTAIKYFTLSQNYPNPFNPTTVIKYQLPVMSMVKVKIYNIFGQEVVTLADEIQDAGYKTVEWNSTNNFGNTAASGVSAKGGYASGVYFYRIEATSVNEPSKTFVQVRKMLLLK